MTEKQLLCRIQRTKAALEREHMKNVEISARVPWGAGMRRVHIGPSCARENELASRLGEYKAELVRIREETVCSSM